MHEIMRMQYDKNIKKNGRFICIKENGFLIGQKNKEKYKINPYETEGKKQCTGECGQILPFSYFTLDKSRRDGYCSRCKKCRKKKYIP